MLHLLSLPPYILNSVKLGVLIGLWAQPIVSGFNFFPDVHLFIWSFLTCHNLHDRAVSCQFTSYPSLQSHAYWHLLCMTSKSLGLPSLSCQLLQWFCAGFYQFLKSQADTVLPQVLACGLGPHFPCLLPTQAGSKGAGINDLRSKSWMILRQFIQLLGDLLRRKERKWIREERREIGGKKGGSGKESGGGRKKRYAHK